MRYIETKPLSQKNQKFIDMFFQESTFLKIGPYTRSDQTKPNLVVYYKSFIIMPEPTKKNFSSIAPSGAEKIDPEVSKFEKR